MQDSPNLPAIPSLRPPAGSRVSGKRVLITGAGGSIGAALTHAVAAQSPASLILLEASEFALYDLDRTLEFSHQSVLGSVTNATLLDDLFSRHRPQIVFHAAAYKHVPLLEQNPFAAIENNIFGTQTLLEAAIRFASEHFILVSTDKAVDPHSIMGASKRVAELLLLTHPTDAPAVSAVRLCNVWGSRGSVVELFLQQIASGEPLPITQPDATRFFIPIEHAIAAILHTLEPRPAGVILVPRVQAALPILQLAHDLLKRHASSAGTIFTGPRPGDKLTEALISPRERYLPASPHDPEPFLRAITSPAPPAAHLHAHLLALDHTLRTRDLPALLRVLLDLVPEYTPSALLSAALTPALQEASR